MRRLAARSPAPQPILRPDAPLQLWPARETVVWRDRRRCPERGLPCLRRIAPGRAPSPSSSPTMHATNNVAARVDLGRAADVGARDVSASTLTLRRHRNDARWRGHRRPDGAAASWALPIRGCRSADRHLFTRPASAVPRLHGRPRLVPVITSGPSRWKLRSQRRGSPSARRDGRSPARRAYPPLTFSQKSARPPAPVSVSSALRSPWTSWAGRVLYHEGLEAEARPPRAFLERDKHSDEAKSSPALVDVDRGHPDAHPHRSHHAAARVPRRTEW